MATNPDTADTLKKALYSVEANSKLYVKAEKPMAKWNAALKAAIDEASLPKIELYRPQVEKALEAVDNSIAGLKGSLALIGQLKSDADFMAAKFETVEKLTVKVADMESRLVALRKVATDLDTQALKALDKLESSRDSLVSDLAELKDQYNDSGKAVDSMEGEAKKWAAATRKAFADKNRQLLTQARTKFLNTGYSQQEMACMRLDMKAQKLMRRVTGDRDLVNQVQEILDGLSSLTDRCKALSKEYEELFKLKLAVPAGEGTTEKNPDYQALRKDFEMLRMQLEKMEKDGERHDAETLKAQKNGDAKAMSAARMKFLNMDYAKLGISATLLKTKATKFQKENAISQAVKGDLQEVIDYAPELADRARLLSKRGAELALLKVEESKGAKGEDVVRAKLSMVQVAKIGDKLGVAIGDNAKLLKLLNKEPYDKWVREVAKNFGLKESDVKTKMVAVDKFDFVKPLYLIDI